MELGRWWHWLIFLLIILAIIIIDLKGFSRKLHKMSFREAFAWSCVWTMIALVFNALIFFFGTEQAGLDFFTAYIVELSLSVDNLFVFLLLFSYFAVPDEYQHRVLFWGILGAIIMRGIFIIAGAALINTFSWMIYVFGGFLILTGIKMMFQRDHKVNPEKNPVLKFLKRIIPMTDNYEGSSFFSGGNGKRLATPLLFVLVSIEFSDVLFAVDSVPAVLAITTNSFIAFTSNIMAVLGLRSLYFLIAHVIGMFRYLSTGLAIILTFIGAKMVLAHYFPIPTSASLLVVMFILTVSIAASVIKKNK
jgi:tellurite resistance protein TerC